jgi:hypothetical protein
MVWGLALRGVNPNPHGGGGEGQKTTRDRDDDSVAIPLYHIHVGDCHTASPTAQAHQGEILDQFAADGARSHHEPFLK